MHNYGLLSDHELTALLNADDPGAYTEIYNRYNALLYIFVYKRLREREEAKDLVHELFLSLWVKRAELSITTGLAAYLYTSARNRIINIITHKNISHRYIESFQSFIDEGNNTTDHLIRRNQLNAFIEKEITALPPKMRQVFEMSRKNNFSRKEIAFHLNLSEQTVKSQVHSALKILKVKLGSFFMFFFF